MLKDASSEFKEAKIEIKEVNNEIKDLPDEIVDADGADELPDEISLDSLENEKGTEHLSENDIPNAVNGGSYRDVKRNSDGETHEVHHMPADSASKLERDDGPSIKMEKEDHRQTESCGSSKEAREYREKQKELINQGKFREAIQMDIDDIHEKFGDKYDDAIAEMLDYVDRLEQEGKLDV